MSLRPLTHTPRRLLLTGLLALCAFAVAEPAFALPGDEDIAAAAEALPTPAAPIGDPVAEVTQTASNAASATQAAVSEASAAPAAVPQAPLPQISTPSVATPSVAPASTLPSVDVTAPTVPVVQAEVDRTVAAVEQTVRETVAPAAVAVAREAAPVARAALPVERPPALTTRVTGTSVPTAQRVERRTDGGPQTAPTTPAPPSSSGGGPQPSEVPAPAQPAPAAWPGPSATPVLDARPAPQSDVLGARTARTLPANTTPASDVSNGAAYSIRDTIAPVGEKPAKSAGARPEAPELPSLPSALGAAASSAPGFGFELPAALLAALLLAAPWLGRLPRPSPGQVRPPLYVSALERPG